MKNRFASNPCGRFAGVLWLVLMICISVNAGPKTRTNKSVSRVQPLNAVAREMLAVHNAIRTDLRLPPLQWSDNLAAFSQRWANTLSGRSRASHNPNSPYGENIFVTGSGSNPSLVVKEWASESRDYSYHSNSCSSDCGHYTQIVWRDTTKVGCAVARGPRRDIWVCSYDPPGNYTGEWPY